MFTVFNFAYIVDILYSSEWSFCLIGMSSIYAFHLTAGDDFAVGPYNVNFTAGQQSATLMLPTVDDNTTELFECFKVLIPRLIKYINRVIIKPFFDVLRICIIDNDPGTYAHSLTIQLIV